jgi:uncharacterized RDD family membrane protein YckC
VTNAGRLSESIPPPGVRRTPPGTPTATPLAAPPPSGSQPQSATGLEDLRSLDSRRVGARLLDGLILGGAYLLINALFDFEPRWENFAFLWATVTYFFVFEALFGQTPGKRYCGLQVMTRTGERPSLNSIATRNTVRILEEPFIALIAMVCTRKRRQRIGDLFASTTVGRAGFSPMRGFDPKLAIYPALWAATAAVIVLFVLPEPKPSTGTPVGYYPPAPSLAGSMTPEWQEFAGQVDRICAYNFNRALAYQNELAQQGVPAGATEDEIQAKAYYAWAESQQATYTMTGELGTPPAQTAIFAQWRENVRMRGDLFKQSGDAWLHDHGAGVAAIGARIDALKLTANDLGQHFGLQICTSNGPSA